MVLVIKRFLPGSIQAVGSRLNHVNIIKRFKLSKDVEPQGEEAKRRPSRLPWTIHDVYTMNCQLLHNIQGHVAYMTYWKLIIRPVCHDYKMIP